MRISNAVRHIEHIASLPLTPHIVIPEMLRALGGIVPQAAPGFLWLDDQGAIIDAYLPRSERDPSLSFCRQFLCDQDGEQRARTGGSLHYQQDGGFHLSLRVGGATKAMLAMGRGTRSNGFTERERRIVSSLAPCFSRALGAQNSKQAVDDMADRIGIIVASSDGRLLSADHEAPKLLYEMSDEPLWADPRAADIDDPLPPLVRDLVRRTAAFKSAPPYVEKTSRWGVYRARAFIQHGVAGGDATTHAVMLSRHLPRIVRLMRTIETCDLSPRERQATYQLGIGADSAAAASALGVSITTWRSYVKRVYQRLDVRDRIELMSFLSGGPST